MTQAECDPELESLGFAFDKRVHLLPELRVEYRNAFSHMSGKKFQVLCQAAKMKCERFPTIAGLSKLAFEMGLFEEGGQMEKSRNPWVVVLCKCGSSFAIKLKNLEEEIDFLCPDNLYQNCGRTYSSALVKARAKGGVADLRNDSIG